MPAGCCRVIDGFETVELINSLGTNTFAGPVNADIRIVVRYTGSGGPVKRAISRRIKQRCLPRGFYNTALNEPCEVHRRLAVFLGSGGMA
jgi:hypothetical protein